MVCHIGRALTNVYKYLKAVCQRDRHFWLLPNDRMRKWTWSETEEVPSEHQETFFFAMIMNKNWHRLPRKGAESPSVQILKGQKEVVLGNYLRVTLLEKGGGIRWLQEVPHNLSHSLILYQSENHSCMHFIVSEELAYRWKQMKERWHWRLSSETPLNAQTYTSLISNKIQLLGQCDLDN